MARSKKELRQEAGMLGESLRPRLSEFFDSWIVIGVRAGSDEALHVSHAPKAQQPKLESVVACVALEMVERKRKCRRARRKK
jgi:hypothetical protein